jgi:hypothetical protein
MSNGFAEDMIWSRKKSDIWQPNGTGKYIMGKDANGEPAKISVMSDMLRNRVVVFSETKMRTQESSSRLAEMKGSEFNVEKQKTINFEKIIDTIEIQRTERGISANLRGTQRSDQESIKKNYLNVFRYNEAELKQHENAQVIDLLEEAYLLTPENPTHGGFWRRISNESAEYAVLPAAGGKRDKSLVGRVKEEFDEYGEKMAESLYANWLLNDIDKEEKDKLKGEIKKFKQGFESYGREAAKVLFDNWEKRFTLTYGYEIVNDEEESENSPIDFNKILELEEGPKNTSIESDKIVERVTIKFLQYGKQPFELNVGLEKDGDVSLEGKNKVEKRRFLERYKYALDQLIYSMPGGFLLDRYYAKPDTGI